MHETPQQYLDLLSDWSNPIFYSVIIGISLCFVLILNYYRYFLPVKKRHIMEKKRLSIENLELLLTKKEIEYDRVNILATLSDTDPNAIIRVNVTGEIIYKNHFAENIFKNGISLFAILPLDKSTLKEIIKNGDQIQDKIKYDNRYYNYYFRGIKSLNSAQVTFFDLTTRMIYSKRLKIQKDKYKSLSLYLQENLEKEKQRIGMELHDSICQKLYLMKFSINEKKDESSALEEFDEILDGTISELRDIIFDLKPKIIEDLGLFNAVKVLSENICKVKNICSEVDYIGEIVPFNVNTEIYLFRIIQEALNNIIKHSEAEMFCIQFIYSEAYLMLMISDDGRGFDTELVSHSNKNGLLNMKERIKALSGKMSIISSEEGTIIKINIPYEKYSNTNM